MMRTLLLALCSLACNVFAADQSDLDKLRQRIAALQQEFDRAVESQADVTDALRESERAISDHQRTLAMLARQQQTARQALQRLQRRIEQAEAAHRQQQAGLSNLLYQQYISRSDEDYLKLLLNSKDPSQLARDLYYLGVIARERSNLLRAEQETLAELLAAQREAKAKEAELARLRATELHELEQLRRKKAQHQQTLRKISQQLKIQRREIDRLKKNEARLMRLLLELAAAAPDLDGTEFSQQQGKLPLPVRGTISNQFGDRRPQSTLTWNGWFIRATENEPVLAIAAGRVVYADWLRGYGNLLIIDHGQGYMSLYGNNQTLHKQVGDVLRAGDLIAAVGNSGGNEDSGLYFELRYKGQPINPARWIKQP